MKSVIFDIDGTIANIEHRRHYVASKPKNWKAFNKGMKDDTPFNDIIHLMSLYYLDGYNILIASGRGEERRSVTEEWLTKQNIICTTPIANIEKAFSTPTILYEKLYMRPAKDSRSDDIIKSEILTQMREDGYEPTIAVDDRDQVVRMWRTAGLRCLQVAPGDF